MKSPSTINDLIAAIPDTHKIVYSLSGSFQLAHVAKRDKIKNRGVTLCGVSLPHPKYADEPSQSFGGVCGLCGDTPEFRQIEWRE